MECDIQSMTIMYFVCRNKEEDSQGYRRQDVVCGGGMKVERGDINLNEATEIFEKIKKLLIKKKKRLESNSKKHALRNI